MGLLVTDPDGDWSGGEWEKEGEGESSKETFRGVHEKYNEFIILQSSVAEVVIVLICFYQGETENLKLSSPCCL